MSGRLGYGIAAVAILVPWAILGGTGKAHAGAPKGQGGPLPHGGHPGPPTPRNPPPMPPGGPLRLPHTSLEDCEDSIEWFALPRLPNGELWEVSTDSPWRADAGQERFRPTPSWNDALEFAHSLGVDVGFPTKELSILTWLSTPGAGVKIAPFPLDITRGDMMGEDYAIESNRLIEIAREGRTGLIATVGKDYVVDPRNRQGRCTIYGWHRLNGIAIQPVSSIHENTYHDYSHHPRLARRVL